MIKLNHVDNGAAFDWGRASEDYAKFRDIYPPEFLSMYTDKGLCLSGQSCLDLGTGTGVIPRNLYKFGATWTGADIAENQIAHAKRLAAENGMNITFIVAPAEETGLPNDTFDVVNATQCFFYFDKAKVLPEIARMLKPRGKFIITSMMWLPHESDIATQSESLVRKYNPVWTGGGFTKIKYDVPEWSKELFNCNGIYDYDMDITFTRESWHGRILACRGIGASTLSPEENSAFEQEHTAYMQSLPESFTIPHWAIMLEFELK